MHSAASLHLSIRNFFLSKAGGLLTVSVFDNVLMKIEFLFYKNNRMRKVTMFHTFMFLPR